MKKRIWIIGKNLVQTGLVLVCTLCLLCGLFLLSAMIPKEAIREHVLESAYEMEQQGDKYDFREGKVWTRMDNYADAAWLNILYSLDPERPWQTMLESPIYVDFGGQEESLTHALTMRVEQELRANTVYDRYWHGSVLLLRPMLVFLNMEQIHWFMAAVLLALFIAVCILMYRRRLVWPAVFLAVLVLPCGLVYVPFCAEYWSPWLLSLLFMLYILCRRPGIREGSLVMLASGSCVAYFDFLTTETVTFGLPFLLLLLLWQQDGKLEKAMDYLAALIRSGLLWVAGYALTLLVKWLGSSALLGQNRVMFALSKASYWEGGSEGETVSRFAGVLENIRMIAPFRGIHDDLDLLLVLLLVYLVLFSFVFLFRKEKAPAICPALLVLACIPVLRLLVMSVHAGYHAFFTYRALYVTLAALTVYVAEKTDWKLVRRKLLRR